MATEATEKSSIVEEKSENVQSEGKIQSHEYSVPITGTQNNKKKSAYSSFILIFLRQRRMAKKKI